MTEEEKMEELLSKIENDPFHSIAVPNSQDIMDYYNRMSDLTTEYGVHDRYAKIIEKGLLLGVSMGIQETLHGEA